MDNNIVNMTGKIVTEPQYNHTCFNEKFYLFLLECKRESNNVDTLQIIISENQFNNNNVYVNKNVKIIGQFRSRNFDNHLFLYVFVYEMELTNEKDLNEIILHGYVCKQPVIRKTPLGREIADIVIAVNRLCGRADYIPCIAWDKDARQCKSINVGDEIYLKGRIQSRIYKKEISGNIFNKTAYEISVSTIKKTNKRSKNP